MRWRGLTSVHHCIQLVTTGRPPIPTLLNSSNGCQSAWRWGCPWSMRGTCIIYNQMCVKWSTATPHTAQEWHHLTVGFGVEVVLAIGGMCFACCWTYKSWQTPQHWPHPQLLPLVSDDNDQDHQDRLVLRCALALGVRAFASLPICANSVYQLNEVRGWVVGVQFV